jgi:hypothetical protein
MNLAFPVVAAQCQPANSDLAEKVMPRDIDLPEPNAARGEQRIQRASFEAPKKLRL